MKTCRCKIFSEWIRNNPRKSVFPIVLLLGYFLLLNFKSAKKKLVDERIHKESFEFNESQQVVQCRMKYCLDPDEEDCVKKKESPIKKCVDKRLKKAKEKLGR